MDAFEKVNELFSICSADTELTQILITDDLTWLSQDEIMGLYDANIRRSFADVTLIIPEELPFMDMSLTEGNSATGNFLVNRAPVEINIYATSFYQASLVYKCIKRLLKANYEDAQIVYEGQRGTPMQGIYCYSMRIKQFVES